LQLPLKKIKGLMKHVNILWIIFWKKTLNLLKNLMKQTQSNLMQRTPKMILDVHV